VPLGPRHAAPMSELLLLAYPFVLIAFVMIAARVQPKD
jgi:hypothetical protein